MDKALEVVEQRLREDTSLAERTPLSVSQILELLSFCLNTTYFSYKGKVYTQCHGAAMGSPVSPIVANLYMERFEQMAVTTAPTPPYTWYRYVDDTFVVVSALAQDELTEHLNSLDDNIKFTTESACDGCLPFLDTAIQVHDDASTTVKIYRKPTHTDQYLNFTSNHHLEHKRSVVRTLLNRADSLVTKDEDKQEERTHIQTALRANNYPDWIFKIPHRKPRPLPDRETATKTTPSVALPYIRGLSEKLSTIFRDHGVSTYHKPINTIRSRLVHPKDKVPNNKKCGVIYKITCPSCNDTYVGETGRSLGTRMKDHLSNRAPLTAVGEHRSKHQHNIQDSDVKILAREHHLWSRKIRESIEIRTEQPALNRDTGYELPAIYSRLLPPGPSSPPATRHPPSHDRPSGGHVT